MAKPICLGCCSKSVRSYQRKAGRCLHPTPFRGQDLWKESERNPANSDKSLIGLNFIIPDVSDESTFVPPTGSIASMH
jgi:hypothetical protein